MTKPLRRNSHFQLPSTAPEVFPEMEHGTLPIINIFIIIIIFI